jgi:hypothetical protein
VADDRLPVIYFHARQAAETLIQRSPIVANGVVIM